MAVRAAVKAAAIKLFPLLLPSFYVIPISYNIY
jgi:hypothetical protein